MPQRERSPRAASNSQMPPWCDSHAPSDMPVAFAMDCASPMCHEALSVSSTYKFQLDRRRSVGRESEFLFSGRKWKQRLRIRVLEIFEAVERNGVVSSRREHGGLKIPPGVGLNHPRLCGRAVRYQQNSSCDGLIAVHDCPIQSGAVVAQCDLNSLGCGARRDHDWIAK